MKNFLVPMLGGVITLFALPAVALGVSFTSSLIQGLSPADAVNVLADQIDSLSGRVDVVEQTASTTAASTTDITRSIDALNAANAALSAKNESLSQQVDEIKNAPPPPTPAPIIIQVPAPEPAAVVPAPPPPAPIVIDTQILAQRYAQLFPHGLHGTVDLWADKLVRQSGMDIAAGSSIEYVLDGSVLGSPSGILGDYSFPLDTTQFANGEHELDIRVDDGAGSTGFASLTISINN